VKVEGEKGQGADTVLRKTPLQRRAKRTDKEKSQMAYVAVNGCVLPEEDACLSPLDRGFLYGDGLFETLRVVGKRVFFLDRHLARMRQAASFLRIPFPDDLDCLGIIQDLQEKNRIPGEASVKICLSRGRHEGSLSLYTPSSPTVVILTTQRAFTSPTDWDKGLSVTVEGEVHQNDTSSLCRLKTMNYLHYLLARTRAQEKGFEDAILTNTANQVCECTTSNLFFFREGRLETPPVSCGLLPGVLREAVMECMEQKGEPVREVVLTPEALRSCDEVFVTNSLLEVFPVGRVDQKKYPVREQTRRVSGLFQAYRDRLHAE
jgi:aminodeoxychorismate lyase